MRFFMRAGIFAMTSSSCCGEVQLVHWFRRGLRLHDNPAFRDGLALATSVRCIYIIDPYFASTGQLGINKWRFLLQSLEDLDSSLHQLNTRLHVLRGQPGDIFPKLIQAWNFDILSFEEEPEPWGRQRDKKIQALVKAQGIRVITRTSHTLYNPEKLLDLNGGGPPLTYSEFISLVQRIGEPPFPEETVGARSDFRPNSAFSRLRHDMLFEHGVPTLEDLGMEVEEGSACCWLGGETEALARLHRHLERKAFVAAFETPKFSWDNMLPQSTALGPYLRFGCLSPRLLYSKLTKLYKQVKGKKPPLSLYAQLLWREFFYLLAYDNPNFDCIQGNPLCVQIPWDQNPQALAKWANGHTGFPFIDAIMTQLKEEGCIHYYGKYAAACFLTRGDLFLSWEDGVKVFEELSLDGDWAINCGTWLWLSGSSFFTTFFRTYCPVNFGRKIDRNGDFIRRYVPVLKDVPRKYIHEPWKMPLALQTATNCVIGRDYPVPVVDHNQVVRLNMERLRQCYEFLTKFSGFCSDPRGVNRPDAFHLPRPISASSMASPDSSSNVDKLKSAQTVAMNGSNSEESRTSDEEKSVSNN